MRQTSIVHSLLLFLAFSFATLLSSQLDAQIAVGSVDESRLTTLHGTVHALARAEFDHGAVADDFPMQRMLVIMQPPPEHQVALQRFLRQAHTPGSPVFHQWVSPEEFGKRFGAQDGDIQTVTAWLEMHGFSVARVTAGKMMIEFSGTARQVREALHTEIHRYYNGGRSFYSNDREIVVPAAIASRIRNFAPLNTYPLTSYLASAGKAALSRSAHSARPEFTTTSNNAQFYALAPEDFATQYDLPPLYNAGTDGSGQTIGIIGYTNINLALVDAYRQLFNLPGDHTQIVVDGEDPGDGSAPNVEAFLDVELSGAVAPNATVNFYVAGVSYGDTLALAALRAVEDNQASVLSLSYGLSERDLGQDANQFWAGLWEQAAAQGQTVLVSSGDTGPVAGGSGLSVSGLSSTPWNVSVGGTDFYYSDYASGGESIASHWNKVNESSLGSLMAPLPEQPWNDTLGFNATQHDLGVIPSYAGGGGSSSCSYLSANSTCVGGYAKPVWQQGTGVPNDGVRDLPDVSLFAANGSNLSAWAICVDPEDCAAGATSSVTLVGGTSASTPAMAGIMALVNQKYGRQGQADYTLYALARHQPGVFHDITLGTNDIICSVLVPGSPGSVPGCTVLHTSPVHGYSFGVYAAGPGYDMATGLGSFDANALISNWDGAALSPSTTTLQLSPATVGHGSPVAVTVRVNADSGSGVPSGDVVLETSPASAMRGNGLLTLSNGTTSEDVTTLPGGTYQVVAQYGGDGVFGASTSTPITLTVTPEKSTTNLSYISTSISGPAGQEYFGSPVTFTATPMGQTTNSSGLATGSVTFTDGSTTATVPLDATGVANWTPQTLALGLHSISVSYSGDASYSPSSSGPIALTVVKGIPYLSAQIVSEDRLAGSTFVVHAIFEPSNGAVQPTGTVTAQLGGLTETFPIVANTYSYENVATAFVMLPNVPAGTYSLSIKYSGDSNWNATSWTYPQQLTFTTDGSAITTTTTLTAAPSTVDSLESVTFNVTVTASTNQYGAPSGDLWLLGNGTTFGGGSISAGTATIKLPVSSLPIGPFNAIAVYAGGGAFESSVSVPVPLNVTAIDFTLSTAAQSLTLQSGQTGTVPLLLGGPFGTGVPVALTCTPSSPTFACSVNPASSTVNGSGTATLTITALSPKATAKLHRPPWNYPGSGPGTGNWLVAGFGSALALATLFFFPVRRRKWTLASLVLIAGISFTAGCGSTNPTSTPAGTYSVLVTGTASGVVHNVELTVVVSAQ